LNDFAAIGHAIPHLESSDWVQMGDGASQVDYPIVVLGPGTGLGVCTLVGTEHGVTVIEGEGGHADFAPTNKEEALVLDVLSAKFGRVSIERLLSGDGLLNIYGALMELERLSSGQSGGSVVADPSDVSAFALAGSDPVAVGALTMFCNILGSVAGNLALTLGAKAGVYIAGGIPGKILSFLENSDIRARFEAKGRFQSYLQKIPLRVVIKEDLGLLGAAHFLSNGRS
ncbi:MAG: glucokinase, partial [Gammaproteobacteria bacterium]